MADEEKEKKAKLEKARRDFLFVSIAMIFFNIARISIEKFSFVVISGETDQPWLVYGLLILVWLYYAARYLFIAGPEIRFRKIRELRDYRYEYFVRDAQMQASDQGALPVDGRGAQVTSNATRTHHVVKLWVTVGEGAPEQKEYTIRPERAELLGKNFTKDYWRKGESFIDWWIPWIVLILVFCSFIFKAYVTYA